MDLAPEDDIGLALCAHVVKLVARACVGILYTQGDPRADLGGNAIASPERGGRCRGLGRSRLGKSRQGIRPKAGIGHVDK